MTDDEAQAQAEQLFGPNTSARDRSYYVDGQHTEWPRFVIELDEGFSQYPLGEGDTWEEAMAEAQKNRPLPTLRTFRQECDNLQNQFDQELRTLLAKYVGKNGRVTAIMWKLRHLSEDDRGQAGERLNALVEYIRRHG
jgi:hypothetical protein